MRNIFKKSLSILLSALLVANSAALSFATTPSLLNLQSSREAYSTEQQTSQLQLSEVSSSNDAMTWSAATRSTSPGSAKLDVDVGLVSGAIADYNNNLTTNVGKPTFQITLQDPVTTDYLYLTLNLYSAQDAKVGSLDFAIPKEGKISSNLQWKNNTPLVDGVYDIQVVEKSNSSNVLLPVGLKTITIDTKAPEVAFNYPNIDKTDITSESISFEITVTDENMDHSNVKFSYRKIGGTFINLEQSSSEVSSNRYYFNNFEFTEAGDYEIRVYAQDKAGNHVADSGTDRITVKAVPTDIVEENVTGISTENIEVNNTNNKLSFSAKVPTEVQKNFTYQLNATLVDQFGDPITDDRGAPLSWSITNDSQPTDGGITVSPTGLLEIAPNALEGSYLLTATSNSAGANGKPITQEITLNLSKAAPVPERIEINGEDEITLDAGIDGKPTYTATVYDQYGINMEKQAVTWAVIKNGNPITGEDDVHIAKIGEFGKSVELKIPSALKPASADKYSIEAYIDGNELGAIDLTIRRSDAVPTGISFIPSTSPNNYERIPVIGESKVIFNYQIDFNEGPSYVSSNNSSLPEGIDVKWGFSPISDAIKFSDNELVISPDAEAKGYTITANLSHNGENIGKYEMEFELLPQASLTDDNNTWKAINDFIRDNAFTYGEEIDFSSLTGSVKGVTRPGETKADVIDGYFVFKDVSDDNETGKSTYLPTKAGEITLKAEFTPNNYDYEGVEYSGVKLPDNEITFTVQPKEVTATVDIDNDDNLVKDYDTTREVFIPLELEGLISGDREKIKASIEGRFEDKNAGEGKPITIADSKYNHDNLIIEGDAAENYKINVTKLSAPIYGAIKPKEVIVTIDGEEFVPYDEDRKPEDIIHKGSFDILDGDDASNYPVKISYRGIDGAVYPKPGTYNIEANIIGEDGGNYIVSKIEEFESFRIENTKTTGLKELITITIAKNQIDNVVDLSDFGIPSPATGRFEYVDVEPSYAISNHKIHENWFEFTLSNWYEDISSEATFDIELKYVQPAGSGYNDFPVTIKVNVTNKTIIDSESIRVFINDWTYGEDPSEINAAITDDSIVIDEKGWEFEYRGETADGNNYPTSNKMPKDPGEYSVTATYTNESQFGTSDVEYFEIKTKELEYDLDSISIKDKTFDNSTRATISGTPKYEGLVSGDKVDPIDVNDIEANFDDSDVDNYKDVTLDFSDVELTGLDAWKYDAPKEDKFVLDRVGTIEGPDDEDPSILNEEELSVGNSKPKLEITDKFDEKLYEKYKTEDYEDFVKKYDDIEEIKDALKAKLSGFRADNTVFFDVNIANLFSENPVEILFPFEMFHEDADDDDKFMIAHMYGDGDIEIFSTADDNLVVTRYGVIATFETFSPVALAVDLAGSSGSSGGSSSGDDFDDMQTEFWDTVLESIESAPSNSTVAVNAKNFDQMPWTVMKELYDQQDIALEIEWEGGNDIYIAAGSAIVPEQNRVYYPLSYLDDIYNGGNPPSGSTGSGNVNPSTGGYLRVVAGEIPLDFKLNYQVTPASMGIDTTIPSVAALPEIAEPTAISSSTMLALGAGAVVVLGMIITIIVMLLTPPKKTAKAAAGKGVKGGKVGSGVKNANGVKNAKTGTKTANSNLKSTSTTNKKK